MKGDTKLAGIRSVLAVIQLVALVQIVVSFLGPRIWRGRYSDLEAHILRGGDTTVAEFRHARETASRDVTRWGVGLAVGTLIATVIGGLLCRKYEQK